MYLASEIGRIAVVDMMIIDQGLDQPKSLKTCRYINVHFC